MYIEHIISTQNVRHTSRDTLSNRRFPILKGFSTNLVLFRTEINQNKTNSSLNFEILQGFSIGFFKNPLKVLQIVDQKLF